MKKLLIILYLILCVAVGAVADGLFDDGLKVWGHALGAVEVALLFSFAFLFNLKRGDLLPLALAYIFFRIAGFDYIYNLTSDNPIFFNGSTSLWDNFLSQFPTHGITFAKSLFLITGVFIPINELLKTMRYTS